MCPFAGHRGGVRHEALQRALMTFLLCILSAPKNGVNVDVVRGIDKLFPVRIVVVLLLLRRWPTPDTWRRSCCHPLRSSRQELLAELRPTWMK